MRAAIGTSWKGNRSLADYIFVLTTLNREDFSVRESLELYRARWQVEKLFQTP
jgi:IS4 transposase